MTEIATVCVQILYRDYPVACPAGQEAELEAAAEFVDTRMREIKSKTGSGSLDRIAVMAALNIAHELLGGGKHKDASVDADIQRMAERISTTLERLQESH